MRDLWLTNGEDHAFLHCSLPGGAWKRVLRSSWLNERLRGGSRLHRVPAPPNTSRVREYLRWAGFSTRLSPDIIEPLLTIEKLVYQPKGFFRLPCSRNGLHILEDRGISPLSISTPGGVHTSDYRVFLVATEGRVETAAIGVNPWDSRRAILCVGFLKENRKHHALQLQLGGCLRRPDGSFDVHHHGRMGGRTQPVARVFEAVQDHGRDDLLRADRGGGMQVHLGRLPPFRKLTWRSVRPFLANLLHYAIIRTNLREGRPYRGSGHLKIERGRSRRTARRLRG